MKTSRVGGWLKRRWFEGITNILPLHTPIDYQAAEYALIMDSISIEDTALQCINSIWRKTERINLPSNSSTTCLSSFLLCFQQITNWFLLNLAISFSVSHYLACHNQLDFFCGRWLFTRTMWPSYFSYALWLTSSTFHLCAHSDNIWIYVEKAAVNMQLQASP